MGALWGPMVTSIFEDNYYIQKDTFKNLAANFINVVCCVSKV